MNLFIVLLLILAPVPKELFKHPIPQIENLKTATNRDLKYWASELYLFKRSVEWIESFDGGNVMIEPNMRKLYMEGKGYSGSEPAVSRYWLLKDIRKNLGGQKLQVDPDD